MVDDTEGACLTNPATLDLYRRFASSMDIVLSAIKH